MNIITQVADHGIEFAERTAISTPPGQRKISNHRPRLNDFESVKLIISPTHAKTLDKEMSFQYYPTVLKQICSALGIVIEKYFHFRRFYGNMDGELNGYLSSSELENSGSWLMTQREECYSTKLPLRPM
jgi:hypothetical protein